MYGYMICQSPCGPARVQIFPITPELPRFRHHGGLMSFCESEEEGDKEIVGPGDQPLLRPA